MVWRYDRIWSEYLTQYYQQLEVSTSIVRDNILYQFMEKYVEWQLTEFVHSPDRDKAWEQYRMVVRPMLIMVTDRFMDDYGHKLFKIKRELEQLLRKHKDEFVTRFRETFRRNPTSTIMALYDNYVDLYCWELDIDTLADWYNVSRRTMMNYLRQMRIIINSLITDFRHEFEHLSQIPLQYLLVPTGALGRRFWTQVDTCRFYTIWHVIGAMCYSAECTKYRDCVCQIFFYVVFTQLYINGCEKKPFCDTYICRERLRDTYIDAFLRKIALLPHWYTLFIMFKDRDDYFDIVDVRNPGERVVFRAMWRRAMREHDYALNVLTDPTKYEVRPRRDCFMKRWT